MPNMFAYFMLLAWPIIGIYFYRRFDTVTATFLTIVGGFLVLPVKTEIDLPMIPAFDKQTIPALSALLGCILIHRLKISLLPENKVAKILVILMLVIPFFTVLTNTEPYFNGAYWIQGMTLYDTVSVIMRQYLLILPFIIAMQIFNREEDLYLLCKLMVLSGLIYSLFVIVEVRVSPQLHTWVYGFFPHSFIQQFRMGGFRPMVFLGHGLMVAIYMFTCFACACILWKNKVRIFKNIPENFIVFYLLFMLLLCKSVGALLFGFALLAILLLNSGKLTRFSANLMIVLVILYPALCIFGFFPHQALLDLFQNYDPARAQSLAFRFYHENLMLQHATEKLSFGWGSWGRNRLDGSVTDGRWIIEVGQFGLFGFIALFGLAVYTIGKCLSGFQTKTTQWSVFAIFPLTCAFIMVDQIINSSLASWSWFFIGSCFFVGRSNMEFNKK